MIDLEAATTPRDGRIVIPAGWRQGRGAYGGVAIATMVRAIDQRVADPSRAVRSITAELPAPVMHGEAELAVEILRSGSSVTTARCTLIQGGEIKAHAVAIAAGARRDAPTWQELAAPAAPPWASIATAPSGGFPEFAQHFEHRPVAGLPLAGGRPETVGWIRALHPGARRDAGYLAAMIDAWYPAALVHLRATRPMATIAYTLDLVGSLAGLADDAPLLYRGHAPVAADGYFVENRELWGDDGRLLALNRQTFAVL